MTQTVQELSEFAFEKVGMNRISYNTDDKLPILPLLLYGLQRLLVTIPSILIIGTVVAQFHYEVLDAQVFYTQKLFAVIVIGLGLVLLQVL